MYTKINIFYPFDKGFFGKTLSGSAGNAVKKVKSANSKVFDSVDDFVHHFQLEMMKKQAPKASSLKSDVFQPKKVEVVDELRPDYPFSMIF